MDPARHPLGKHLAKIRTFDLELSECQLALTLPSEQTLITTPITEAIAELLKSDGHIDLDGKQAQLRYTRKTPRFIDRQFAMKNLLIDEGLISVNQKDEWVDLIKGPDLISIGRFRRVLGPPTSVIGRGSVVVTRKGPLFYLADVKEPRRSNKDIVGETCQMGESFRDAALSGLIEEAGIPPKKIKAAGKYLRFHGFLYISRMDMHSEKYNKKISSKHEILAVYSLDTNELIQNGIVRPDYVPSPAEANPEVYKSAPFDVDTVLDMLRRDNMLRRAKACAMLMTFSDLEFIPEVVDGLNIKAMVSGMKAGWQSPYFHALGFQPLTEDALTIRPSSQKVRKPTGQSVEAV